jgi:organic hydroperoxide reductase OsmC/OhrA
MSIIKDFQFPVSVQWEHGRLTRVHADGGPDFRVAPPPQFKGGVEGLWSPEDLLVASTASCYAITVAAVAGRWSVPLESLEVSGCGHVTRRQDGRQGFLAIELDVRLVTEPGFAEAAEQAARRAEDACLVAQALDVPVQTAVTVTTTEPALVS